MQTFDPDQFKLDYPSFGLLSDNYLTNVFNNSVLVTGKVIWGLLQCGTDAELYYAELVLAHVLTLRNGQNGDQNGQGRVGVVSAATEGSVSGTFNIMPTSDSAWWQSTSYGAECYELLKQRGGATYFPGAQTYNGYDMGGAYG